MPGKRHFAGRFLFFGLIALFCFLKESSYLRYSVHEVDYATGELMDSVVKIHIYKDNGVGHFTSFSCSAFAFGKAGNKYRFASAGHCFVENGKKIKIDKILLVFEGKEKESEYGYFAKLVAFAEDKENGKDFAVLEAEIDFDAPILELSSEDPFVGQCVVVAGFPGEADGNIFVGPVLNALDLDGDTEFMILGIKEADGASGSPILRCDKKEVIGIFVASSRLDKYKLYAKPISGFVKWKESLNETPVK